MKIDVMLRVEIRAEGSEADPFDLAEEVKMVIYDLPEVYDVTLLALRPGFAKNWCLPGSETKPGKEKHKTEGEGCQSHNVS